MAGDFGGEGRIFVSVVDKDSSLLGRIVIGDEKLCFLYNPHTKRAFATRKSPQSPQKQKFHHDRSKGKVMLEVFSNISMALCIWKLSLKDALLPKNSMSKSCVVCIGRSRRRDQKCGPNDFLAKTKTTILPHPPYSPDLAPYDFFLFPELARCLQGHQFQSSDEVKCALQAELKDMVKNGFQTYLNELYRRWQ
ncbi:uncharacterized protein LOC118200271, partial [Stegodyphus dumicola]|uniref:uncharacterized protein LOC118200271 n=1 Tax=Stegodyphus dumicola TaxID=202533 RepID=UPI0015A9E61D